MTNTKLAVSKNGGSEILSTTTTLVDKPLTAHETMAFERCCKVVDEGAKKFIEVGEALATMKQGRLWRVAYPNCTWEQFVEKRWGFSRQRSYQLMNASALARDLETTVAIPNEKVARAFLDSELKGNPDAIGFAAMLAATTAAATSQRVVTEERAKAAIAIVVDAMATGLVDTGKGNWQAAHAAITHEMWVSTKQKEAEIAAKRTKPVATFPVSGDVLKVITPPDADGKIDDSKQYRAVIYEVVEVEGK